jgi:hypothetical protein
MAPPESPKVTDGRKAVGMSERSVTDGAAVEGSDMAVSKREGLDRDRDIARDRPRAAKIHVIEGAQRNPVEHHE